MFAKSRRQEKFCGKNVIDESLHFPISPLFDVHMRIKYNVHPYYMLQDLYVNASSDTIVHDITDDCVQYHLYAKIQLLGLLLNRHGDDFVVGESHLSGKLNFLVLHQTQITANYIFIGMYYKDIFNVRI